MLNQRFLKVLLKWLCSLALAVASAAQAVTILPVGDSITEGYGGQCSYRKPLAQLLFQDYGCALSFVGSRATPRGDPSACRATNTAHEGRSFLTVNELIEPMAASMKAQQIDFLLVHLGSNDLFYGDSTETIIADLELLIDRAQGINSNVSILLAGIIPWDPTRGFDSANLDELQLSNDLAAAIGQLVKKRSGEQIYFVDANTGFDNASMTDDGVHPNDLGERFLAGRFLSVLNTLGVCENPAADQAFSARLANVGSGRCIEMPQASTVAGSLAGLAQCADSASQQLLFDPVASFPNTYTIQFQHSRASNLCLDASRSSLSQQQCGDSNDQQFRIDVEAIRYRLSVNGMFAGESGSGGIDFANDDGDLARRWRFDHDQSSPLVAGCDPAISSRFLGNSARWHLLSLPCTAPSGTIMADLINDAALAPSEWEAYRYQAVGNDVGYKRIAAADLVPQPGVGFWFASTKPVTLEMPAGSLQVARSNAMPCTAAAPCYRQQIDARPRWSMLGNPFGGNLRYDDIQVVNSATTCSTSSACSLDNIAGVASAFYTFDGNDYREFAGAEDKQRIVMPWDAYWAALQVDPASRQSIDSAWQLYLKPYESQFAFITHGHYDGDLGGLAGADALCQLDAIEAGLPGTYKAWMGNSNSGPDSAWSRLNTPYIRTDGQLLARNFAHLVSGALLNSIDMTAFGVSVAPTAVWTNVTTQGYADSASLHCSNWNSAIGSARVGLSNRNDASWTSSGGTRICATQLPFYCVGQ